MQLILGMPWLSVRMRMLTVLRVSTLLPMSVQMLSMQYGSYLSAFWGHHRVWFQRFRVP